MLVIDATALFEVVAGTATGVAVRHRVDGEVEHAAPHLVDAEVLAAITTHERTGGLDPTAAALAAEELRRWPARRWSHRPFLQRAWELRHNVRSYDAMYVALAEFLDAPLLTLDRRLSRAPGLRCEVEVL